MKRCPQCLFIYPESDSHCDFDNTPLAAVDEAELEAATSPAPATSKSKTRSSKSKSANRRAKLTGIASVLILALGVVAFFVYYRLSHRAHDVAPTAPVARVTADPTPQAPPIVSPSPVETPSPSPSPSPSANTKEPAPRVATAHSNTTIAPVSTSGPGMGKKLGGKPAILLTSGGKIDADEVWRTKDGVWYRRDGIVTLLKPGRVRAIVNQ
jgi:hypothetical protein